jgi:predicted DNA-binding transcriptional regulator AlpA
MATRGRPRKTQTEAADVRRDTIPPALPAEFLNFDRLPDSALVRLPVVQCLLGCSASSVWRNSRAGNLPKPIKLTSNISGWRVGDLRAALNRGVA